MSDRDAAPERIEQEGQIMSVDQLRTGQIVEQVIVDPSDPDAPPTTRRIGIIALNYNFVTINKDLTKFDDDPRAFVGMVSLGDAKRTLVAEPFYLTDVALAPYPDGSWDTLSYLRFVEEPARESFGPRVLDPA